MEIMYLVIYLAFMTLIGLQVVVFDKKAAKHQLRRVAEAAFFILALMGGSVGIFAGMLIMHHETRKLRFVLGIPFIIFFQVFLGILYFLWF